MKIVVVTEHFQSGGLETHLLGFARALQNQGHTLSFVVGAGARLSPLQNIVGERILQLPFTAEPDGRHALELAGAIAGFCRAERADLLHLHPFTTLLLGALAAEQACLPFVITLHGPSNLQLPGGEIGRLLLGRVVFESAARIYCVSADLMPEVRAIHSSAPITYLPNGVDPERTPMAAREPGGEWAVIARLDGRKTASVQSALAALGALPRHNFRMRVFGDGVNRAALEAWIADQSFAPRVCCEGFDDRLGARLQRGYAGAAGMGRSLLEAAAAGLPVMIAGYDGVKGLLRDDQIERLSETNYTGRDWPTIEPSQLAAQFDDLEAHPERYDLRAWIARHADERRIWESYVEQVRTLTIRDSKWPRRLATALARHPQQALFAAETMIEPARFWSLRRLAKRFVPRALRGVMKRERGIRGN